MITLHTRIYDLVVIVLLGEKSRGWFWTVRPLKGDDNYQIELANGLLYTFVSNRGQAESEAEAIKDASAFAIRTARRRVLPFTGLYTTRLGPIEPDPWKTITVPEDADDVPRLVRDDGIVWE